VSEQADIRMLQDMCASRDSWIGVLEPEVKQLRKLVRDALYRGITLEWHHKAQQTLDANTGGAVAQKRGANNKEVKK